MGGQVVGSRKDDLAILDNASDADSRGAVRRRRGELHQAGRVCRSLEVAKGPAGRRVVGLHALQGVHEICLALDVDGTVLRRHRPLGGASWPDVVAHGAPRVLEIRSKERLARRARLEARGDLLHCNVDHGPVVVHRLDRVRVSVCRELDGTIVGVKRRLVLAEVMVVELGRAPQMLLGLVGAEDLEAELAGGADAAASHVSQSQRHTGTGDVRHITKDDLAKGKNTGVRHEVEALRLDRGRVQRLPLQIIPRELCVGCRLGFLGDRLDGRGSVDGLLSAGDVGHPGGGQELGS